MEDHKKERPGKSSECHAKRTPGEAGQRREIYVILAFFLISVLFRYLQVKSQYPIRLGTYPDELRYYRIAGSLANGDGIRIFNARTNFQKILYSVLIAPAFLAQSARLRMSLFYLINACLMSSGVFAVHLLAKRMLKKPLHRVGISALYLTWAFMTYTRMAASENLYIPLVLFTMCVFFDLFSIQAGWTDMSHGLERREGPSSKGNSPKSPGEEIWKAEFRKACLLSLWAGILSYLCYLTKEIAWTFPIAYTLLTLEQVLFLLHSRQDRRRDRTSPGAMPLSSEETVSPGDIPDGNGGSVLKKILHLLLPCLIYLFSFGLLFLFFKLTLFAGTGNSYSQQDIGALFKGDDKIPYLVYGMVYYIVCALVMSFGIPPLSIALSRGRLEKPLRLFSDFLSWMLLSSAFIVSFTITLREDYDSVTPRAHMRYIAYLPILFLLLFTRLAEERDGKREKSERKRDLLIAGGYALCLCVLFHGFQAGNPQDNTMWLIHDMSRNGIFFLMVLLGSGALIWVFSGGRYGKILWCILFAVIISVQVYDNIHSSAIMEVDHVLHEEEGEEVTRLVSFVSAHPDLHFLVVDEYSTRMAMALDANLIQRNVYVTSAEKMEEAGLCESAVLSDRQIPVIWSADNSSYPETGIDVIIARRYRISPAGENVKRLEDQCTEHYEVYEVLNPEAPLSLFRDYLDVGEAILFAGDGWNSDEYIRSGLSGREDSFMWTNGVKVVFEKFKLGPELHSGSFLMKLEIELINGDEQLIIVKNNGAFAGQKKITEGGTVTIPVTTSKKGYLNLSIMLPYAISPKEWTGIPDRRQLGIALKKIVFERSEDA